MQGLNQPDSCRIAGLEVRASNRGGRALLALLHNQNSLDCADDTNSESASGRACRPKGPGDNDHCATSRQGLPDVPWKIRHWDPFFEEFKVPGRVSS
jgi:hypothetical protein